MSRAVYVTGIGPESGKVLVVLGMMSLAHRETAKVGFFKPILDSVAEGKRDEDIELILRQFELEQSYEDSFAFHAWELEALLGAQDEEGVAERLIARYKHLEAHCDFILMQGTDFRGAHSTLDMDLNAFIARNLSADLVVVGRGDGQSLKKAMDSLQIAVDAFGEKKCTVRGVFFNKVAPEDLEEAKLQLAAAYQEGHILTAVFPKDPSLAAPTLGQVKEQLGATVLFGEDRLDGLVEGHLVGEMYLENLLIRLKPGYLVLTTGDRTDLLVGMVQADQSIHYPRLAGLILTSGIPPAPEMLQLIEGLGQTLPMLQIEEDTYQVAARLEHLHADIRRKDPKKIEQALRLFERHIGMDRLLPAFATMNSKGITPRMFTYDLMLRARAQRRHIVLPEGGEPRILKAAAYLMERNLVELTLLGNRRAIERVLKDQGIVLDLEKINLIDPSNSPDLERYAETYFELRKAKGVTLDAARETLLDIAYFGTMMVHLGEADGMVSGACHTTQHTIRPALQFIKTRPGFSLVSSIFFMCLQDGVVVYGDCAVNPDPTAPELAEIAISAAATARLFGLEPRVALLSYSSGASGTGDEVDKVREAVRLAHERDQGLPLEGPIQYDAAVDEGVAALKMPGSLVAGHANVLIFPDLNTGNNTYKAVQRETGALAIGPILQGLKKPVNDLSRGCTVDDIINTVVITAIQSQS
jgi:phosphate acetyltransferase